MKKYSIIIPHKNTPTLLQRLLNSIPSREDVEIIVVDDNSDSQLVDFATFQGINNRNSKVIFSKEGNGAGYARNIGINHAQGEWLLFADSDDYFYTEQLNAFLNTPIPDTYDVVVYGADYCYLDGSKRVMAYNPQLEECKLTDSDETSKLYFDYCTPWVKMVRRRKIVRENLRFEEIQWGNDMMFSAQLALSTPKYAIYNSIIYCHERRPNSLYESTTGNYHAYRCRTESFFRINRMLRNANRALLPTEHLLREIYKTKRHISFVFLMVQSLVYCGPRHTLKTLKQLLSK